MAKVPEAVEPLWNENADKYQCCCRSVHVKTGTLYIGYAQLLVTLLFVGVFSYCYMNVTGGGKPSTCCDWMSQYNEPLFTGLMMVVLVQLTSLCMLLHGANTERRGYLMPFIIFAAVGVFLGVYQVLYDAHRLVKYADSSHFAEFSSHAFGTLVHAWCLDVVWRCYKFFGDKKVAVQIGEQLRATQAAFTFGDMPRGYMMVPDPPAYADTVISDKQPLTSLA